MDIVKADYVKEIVRAMMERIGFEDAQISLREPVCEGQGDFICNIRVEQDSNLLIGQHGVNLQALQHIARLVTKKHFGEHIVFSLDVNSYWEQKSQAIAKEARTIADKVVQTQESVAMRPMEGYERKIVHAELAKDSRIQTESAGLGENRKVIVKLASEKSEISEE